MIDSNLKRLRKINGLSQEQVAEKISVSRQAVAKWESGASLPDVYNLKALAELYGVTADSLLEAVSDRGKTLPRPKGKHVFGVIRVGHDGTLKLPRKALKVFGIEEGEMLLVLGDESQGIALCRADFVTDILRAVKDTGCGNVTLEDIIPSDKSSE